jgi:serine/threonine protein phosphatase PrpC
MKRAVEQADAAVRRLPNDAPPKSGLAEPQATLVLAWAEADRLWYAWVGDSRIYLITDAQVQPLSTDDSLLSHLLASGVALETALKSPDAHCITQCLGMLDASPDIHVASRELPVGARVLLCSDGFWNYAPDPHTVQGLVDRAPHGREATLEERCIGLVDFANARGGGDNITVALYRHGAGA